MNVNEFEIFVNEVVRKELERVSNLSKLYILSWYYALAQALDRYCEDLYNNMKSIVLELLNDEDKFKIYIYDHEGAAGLLFSLYHIFSKDEFLISGINKVLDSIKKLKWHDFDGEIMAFSYILAKKINNSDYVKDLGDQLAMEVEKWYKNLDYESQRNIIYILFGLAYNLDEKVLDFVEKFKLYEKESYIVKKITNLYDVEPSILLLYVLGRIAYNKQIARKLVKTQGKNIVKNIRYEIIPFLSNYINNYLPINQIPSESVPSSYESLPPDVVVKFQLARVESGLDKPITLSKFEWEAYQEVKKMLKEGFYQVKRSHLLISIVLDSILVFPLVSVFLGIYFPNPIANIILTNVSNFLPPLVMMTIFPILLILLISVNVSILKYGSIKINEILYHIVDFFMRKISNPSG